MFTNVKRFRFSKGSFNCKATAPLFGGKDIYSSCSEPLGAFHRFPEGATPTRVGFFAFF